jgi:hypothetical protein
MFGLFLESSADSRLMPFGTSRAPIGVSTMGVPQSLVESPDHHEETHVEQCQGPQRSRKHHHTQPDKNTQSTAETVPCETGCAAIARRARRQDDHAQ